MLVVETFGGRKVLARERIEWDSGNRQFYEEYGNKIGITFQISTMRGNGFDGI